MNFKDAYKSMNDEIHGDKALMHMIINGEAPKKKKNIFAKFKPVYSVVLAAVFAMCVITLYRNTGFDDYSATGKKSKPDAADLNTAKTSKVTDDKVESDYAFADAEAETGEAQTTAPSGEAGVHTASKATPKAKPVSSPNTVPNYGRPVSKSSSASSLDAYNASESASPQSDALPASESAENASKSSGSGSNPAQVNAKDNSQTNSAPKSSMVPENAFSDLKGYSSADKKESDISSEQIMASIEIPDDMMFAAKKDENGELSAGYIGTSTDGNNVRKVDIKITNEASDAPNVYKSKHDGVYISVEASGLSESEMENLIESITE